MSALDQVKYVLAQLPENDLKELHTFLDGLIVTEEEAERAVTKGENLVASVSTGRRGRPRKGGAGAITYRLEHVKCGKKTCTKCPHGPYVYKYWREDGRLRKKYCGKPAKPAPAREEPTGPTGPKKA